MILVLQATPTQVTARAVLAVVVVVVSPRGTATPMPMGLPTTTMVRFTFVLEDYGEQWQVDDDICGDGGKRS